ncbi:MAG: FlgD immunoglobulin-like domain containing protein, partial [Candidatus Binatia bacterium]
DCNQNGQRKDATVSVLCKNPPCVALTNVVANKASACPNEAIVVSGKVTNCGTDSATYTVTVGGVQVFTGTLAPGASQNFSRDVTMGECVAGNNVTWNVDATASNTCGGAHDDAVVSVRCKAKPCVELVANREPASACPGDRVTISGTVKNCSIDPETIVVTIDGVQVLNQVVASGATQAYSRDLTMPQCTAGQNVSFVINATATNDCDQVGDKKTATVQVQCKNAPCALLTDVAVNKQAACPNELVIISGKVKNCGTDSATFTVTVGGVQVYTGTLAPGADAPFNREVSMGECVAGNNVTWTVSATAVNSCGHNSVEQSVSVRCKSKPCVEVKALGPNSSCVGRSITITGKAKNCSLDAEVIVVTVDGQQAYNASVAAGAEVSWTITLPMKDCVAGQSVTYNVSATASNSCGQDTKTTQVVVLCQAPPCVAIDLNAPAISCVGATIKLCGSVTNCSPGPETIELRYGDQVQRFENVAPGTSKSYCFEVVMAACVTGDVREWVVTASATSECGRVEKTAVDETKCKLPIIKVKKAAESLVNDGGIIHYTIIVENAGEVDLQNVLITDTMCKYTVYNNHANPAAYAEPAVGQNGVVIWKIALLKKGESQAFTFEAKASLAAGGASCPGDVVCTNRVEALGYCFGSDNTYPVKDTDQTATTIRCAVLNCPRTAGFWTQQCAQKTGGSTKFSRAQMDQITAKVDDVSSFFDWASGDFNSFCAIVNPPSPMDQRKQAKRQFAVLLANYATDLLNLTPNNGAELLLDASTPVSCAGLNARTIGELITEVDLLLATLEGQDLTQVKARYGDIISCTDAINNGLTIPTTANCEHGSDTSGSQSGGDPSIDAVNTQLYRAVPNPFASVTQFSYEVTGAEAGVDIAVYDVAGRQIRKLVHSTQQAGRYIATWDGKSDDGVSVTRGVYFVRTVIAGTKAPVQRLLFVRDAQ